MAARSTRAKGSGLASDILDVASKQLNVTGISPDWFTDIAAELGISRTMLYQYAKDREDLLLTCYLRSCELVQGLLDAACAKTNNPREILEVFLQTVCAGMTAEVAVLREIDALPAEMQATVRLRRTTLVGQLAAVVERGAAEGLFRPIDPVVVANAILGMAEWLFLQPLWGPRTTPRPSSATLGEILFRGLAADRTRPLEKPGRLLEPAPHNADPFDRMALAEAKREAILRAASLLFNRRGIGATRIEDVATDVGLNKRAIYHHVGQKPALVGACVDRAYAYYLRLLDAAENHPLSRLAALFGAIRDTVEASCDPALGILVPYVGYGLLSPERQMAVSADSNRAAIGYQRILLAGIEEGSIRRLPIGEVISSLPGVFFWASNSSTTPGANPASIADQLASVVAAGIVA